MSMTRRTHHSPALILHLPSVAVPSASMLQNRSLTVSVSVSVGEAQLARIYNPPPTKRAVQRVQFFWGLSRDIWAKSQGLNRTSVSEKLGADADQTHRRCIMLEDQKDPRY